MTKMLIDRSTVEQALEALGSSLYPQPRQVAAITALRAALAERDNYAESASLLAQAVVLAEREKCAQLVETYEKAGNTMNAPEYVMVFKDCAAAIRARGRQ